MDFVGHAFRLTSFAVFATTLWYNITHLFVPGVTDSYGGRKKFLTYLNTTSLTIYTGCSFFAGATKITKLRTLRDLYFAAIVFPFSTFVSFLFWTLFIIKEELVFPKWMSAVVPKHGWYNHTVHSGPLLFALLDMLFTHHIYPSRKRGLTLTVVLGLSYVGWLLWLAHRASIWVYPVLEKLNSVQLAIFLMAMSFIVCLFYLIGEYINQKCVANLWKTGGAVGKKA